MSIEDLRVSNLVKCSVEQEFIFKLRKFSSYLVNLNDLLIFSLQVVVGPVENVSPDVGDDKDGSGIPEDVHDPSLRPVGRNRDVGESSLLERDQRHDQFWTRQKPEGNDSFSSKVSVRPKEYKRIEEILIKRYPIYIFGVFKETNSGKLNHSWS